MNITNYKTEPRTNITVVNHYVLKPKVFVWDTV